MKTRKISVVVLVCALATVAAVWAAQPDSRLIAMEAGGGPFAVSGSGDSAILLETTTGKTWVLERDISSGQPVWVAVSRRIDSDEKVKDWYRLQRAIKEQIAKEKAKR